MKKTLLIILPVLVLASGISLAESGNQQALPTIPFVASASQAATALPVDFTVMGHPNTGLQTADGNAVTASDESSFAQLDGGQRPLPLLSMWLFPLIALGVLALRVYGVHRARQLAEQESQTHRARSQMYRTLHERD